MQWNLTKKWITISSLLVSATSFADPTANNQTLLSSTPSEQAPKVRSLENRVAALEMKRGGSGMINPPVRPIVEDYDINPFGELLIWQTDMNDLNVAVKNNTSGFATTSEFENLQDSHVKHIEFDYRTGFRLGLDYDSPRDGWDLGFTWLRIDSKGDKDSDALGTEEFFASRINPALVPFLGINADTIYQDVSSRFKGHLDQLDLDLGREFFVSKWLTLRPHFGVRTTWIRQRLKTHYNNGIDPTVVGMVAMPNVEVREKNNWWGMGVEGGLDTQWGLGAGISLYGNLAAAIETGFQKVRTKEEIESTDTIFENNKDSYRVSRPILDLQLGVRWDKNFADNSVNFGLYFGWEQHIYFSQNQFHVETNLGQFVANQGDLGFHGFTIGAHIAL